VLGAFECTEAAGDFLLHFWHPHALFPGVICEGHGGVMDKTQDGIGMLAHAAQQVEGDRLLNAPTLARWLEYFGIELFAVAQYLTVKGAEGGDVGAAQYHAFLPDRFAQRVGLAEELAHLLGPSLTGQFLHIDQFAQQMRVAQGVYAIERPVWRPAIMDEDAQPIGQDAMGDDRLHTALGMHAVPGMGRGRGDMQPVQFLGHAQARLVRMHYRRRMQLPRDHVRGPIESGAGLGNPGEQRAGRRRNAVQVAKQLGGARIRQHLAMDQMDGEGLHVRAVLHRLRDRAGEGADVHLAAAANLFQDLVLDNLTRRQRNVDDLPARRDAGAVGRQLVVTMIALARQWMNDGVGRLRRLHQRRSIVARLPAGLLARGLAQRIRLLPLIQTIGRWWHAGVVAVLTNRLASQSLFGHSMKFSDQLVLFWVRERRGSRSLPLLKWPIMATMYAHNIV
jgi:hypothetical protein